MKGSLRTARCPFVGNLCLQNTTLTTEVAGKFVVAFVAILQFRVDIVT